jgi:hypothetical protein
MAAFLSRLPSLRVTLTLSLAVLAAAGGPVFAEQTI